MSVIDFESKQKNYRPISQTVIEDVVEHPGDYAVSGWEKFQLRELRCSQAQYQTEAMVISTQHLLMVKDAQLEPPPLIAPALVDNPIILTESEETKQDGSVKESVEGTVSAQEETVKSKATTSDGDVEMQEVEPSTKQESVNPSALVSTCIGACSTCCHISANGQ